MPGAREQARRPPREGRAAGETHGGGRARAREEAHWAKERGVTTSMGRPCSEAPEAVGAKVLGGRWVGGKEVWAAGDAQDASRGGGMGV